MVRYRLKSLRIPRNKEQHEKCHCGQFSKTFISNDLIGQKSVGSQSFRFHSRFLFYFGTPRWLLGTRQIPRKRTRTLSPIRSRQSPRQLHARHASLTAPIVSVVTLSVTWNSTWPASRERLPEPLSRRIRLSLTPLKTHPKQRTDGLICPFPPPRLFLSINPSGRWMVGAGGSKTLHGGISRTLKGMLGTLRN